jgi:hypothetical protein
MFFQIESPRWLIKAGRTEEALDGLSRVRRLPRDHECIEWEMETVWKQIAQENELGADRSFLAKLKEAFSKGTRNRLLTGMALMLLQNLSGINALNYYSPTIFKSLGFTGTSVGLLATGIFGIVKTSGTIMFMLFAVDRLGRRPAMLLGSCGAMVAMFYLAGFSKLSGSFEGHATKDAGAYVAILMVYIFAVFYSFSWNGVPWIFW